MILLILQHSFFLWWWCAHNIFTCTFSCSLSRERQRERKLGNSAVAHTLLWHTALFDFCWFAHNWGTGTPGNKSVAALRCASYQ